VHAEQTTPFPEELPVEPLVEPFGQLPEFGKQYEEPLPSTSVQLESAAEQPELPSQGVAQLPLTLP
jgi:hypothetical protein